MRGLAGDRYYRPMQVQGDWKPYSGSVMAIDPRVGVLTKPLTRSPRPTTGKS